MPLFKGAGVAIVTPMKENLEVNYEQLETNINYQIDNGTDAIIIAGTTGESSTLTIPEHLDVIKAAIEFTKHRVPVIAGAGSNCTRTAMDMSAEAKEAGADGVLLVTPYYNKATQGGLIRHYTMIAEAAKVPVILYNVPSRTGCNLMPETVASLVKNVDNIVGLKDATGNIAQAMDTMNLCDGKLELYSGNDDQVVPLLSIGGIGVISVLSNIAPRETHDIVADYLDGNLQKSLDMQMKALPLIHALFSEVNPIPVKCAMNMLGMNAGSLRAPLFELEQAHQDVLREEMVKFGLLK